MRIAAGVILILAAVINIFAALGYLAGGAVSAGAGTFAEAAKAEAEKGGATMSAEDKAKLDEAVKAAKSGGSGLLIFGIVLVISVVTSITGAVFLFTQKKAKFIQVAGGLAVLVEVVGIVMTAFGITNLIGIVGGILAILAAKSIGQGSASA